MFVCLQMEGADGAAVPPSLADRSHRSSISSMCARSVDVLVYLIDDTVVQLSVDSLMSVTVHELHRIVRDALQLPECAMEVFALWLISPLLDEPSLQFRRNVFFPKRRELQIENEAVLRLLYEEAKFNILEGRYPCDVEDCEQLGALVCRLQLGPYDQDQHTACALKEKLEAFLPAHLCRRGHSLLTALWKRGAKQPAYEQGLLQAYQTVREEAACNEPEALRQHYRAYLQRCHQLPYYGCAFFYGEIDKPAQGFLHRGGRKAVSVAISLEGVYVMDSKEKHVLLGLRFQELSWDHTYPDEEEEHILWLEFDGENEGILVNKLLKIYSKQAELMSGLIEYCLELNVAAEASALENSTLQSPTLPALASKQRPKLRRQNSVVCSRIQHLATIDYIEDGKEIKRVKPKRTASFFTRQFSHGAASYSAVQAPAESLEQG
ncbi:FERM domain-containing protein 8 isoform X2 [Gopherus flavomarginatus]|uniref:FERM domain-containing protein 8 isoform X2 n=1 Tax=Gopherus flavomarginatus TaxID=286002 RepID=UPI0021CC054F|nr:FERM domain-containing protein 8 isoform X2 [Gopherus flavomarginatus]